MSLFFIVLTYVGLYAVEKMLAREKTDPEYAAKRDRFRERAEKFIPSKDTEAYIAAGLFVLGFIYFTFITD